MKSKPKGKMILTVTLNTAIDNIWKLESFEIGSINRAEKNAPLKVAGGKGINVARVITKLGGDALAIGFVGGDTGKLIELKLNEEKINHEFIHIKGESRECLTIIDTKNKKETVINGVGPEISSPEVEMFKHLFLKMIPKCNIVCLSGSVPPGVPTDIYEYLITQAHEKNVPVILDTSNETLEKGIQAKPFMVKSTTEEVEYVLNLHNIESDDGIIKAAKYFSHKGTKSVAITRGEKDAIICIDEDLWKISPPQVEVINSVGSGDAFVGGFAVSIANGNSRLDAFVWGIAAGSANAEKLKIGDITSDRVKELLKKVKFYPINIGSVD